MLACAGPAAAQTAGERDVKAAFLYNFTRFVEWPGNAAPGAEPFRLCVVADAAMRRTIAQTVTGEAVNGRPILVTEPQRPQDAQRCQILFVGRSEWRRASRFLDAVRNRPVLTVGESTGFRDRGGVIEFVLEENRVRFDVNLESAQRSRLKLSSNLLRVARDVQKVPQ